MLAINIGLSYNEAVYLYRIFILFFYKRPSLWIRKRYKILLVCAGA